MRVRAIAKLIMVSLLLMAAVGLAWWVGRELRSAPGRRIVLTSGVEISVLGVTYGTNHIQPGFGRFLPEIVRVLLWRLTGLSSGGRYRHPTDRPELVVWVTHNATNSPAWPIKVRVALADDNGFLGGDSVDYSVSARGNTVIPMGFEVWPRRSRELRIRVFEQGSSSKYRLAGEVRCKNPAVSRAPAWIAEPLPAHHTNGALVCILSGVFTGVDMGATASALGNFTTYSPPQGEGETRAMLRLELQDREQPSNAWEIAEIHIADARGNPATNTWMSANYGPGPERCYEFKPALWPSDAWRLELLALRQPDAVFATNELVVFTNVALPAIGDLKVLRDSKLLGGTEVSLVSCQRQQPRSKDVRRWSLDGASVVALSMANLHPGAKLTLIRATDDSGRKLEVPAWEWGWGHRVRHDTTFSFVHVPAEARTLNLVFAIQQMRSFTFFVKPALSSTNDLTPEGP